MKKIKLISISIVVIIVLSGCFTFKSINTVNAATTQATVTYGEITENGVEVTVKFSKDISENTFSNKWNKEDSNTIKATFAEGACAYVYVKSSDGSIEEGKIAIPIKLQEKATLDMTSKDTDVTISNLSVQDTSIVTVDGLKIKAVKEGKTKINADVKFTSDDETKKYTWDVTVVAGGNTTVDNTSKDGQISESELWADFSKVTYTLNIVDNEHATVKINGLNNIKGSLAVYFSSKGETEEEVLNNYKKYFDKSEDFEWCLVDDTNTTSLSSKAFELLKGNSDIYMHIVQIAEAKNEDSPSTLDFENVKVVVPSVKINTPEEKLWTDFSKATYIMNIVDDGHATVKINGINGIKGSLVVYFSSKEETEEEVLDNYKKYYNKSEDFEWCLVDDTNTTSLSSKAYELFKGNSDIYMHIVQIAEDSLDALDYNNVKVIVPSVKINKTENEKKIDGKDDTTADNNLPQTGIYNTVLFTISVVAIVTVISFIRYRKYKNLK